MAVLPDFSKRHASGGEVSHLESGLRMLFAPRSSGQRASAFKHEFIESTHKYMFIQRFKSLAAGRAAGGH